MKRLVLFCILCLILSGCIARSSRLSPSEKEYLKDSEGRTHYTKVNIWYYKPKNISSTNLHKGSILPIGTKVTILHCKGRKINFSVDSTSTWVDSEIPFCLTLHRKSRINLRQLFDRYFSKENTMIEGGSFSEFTIEEQEDIKSGNISYGMSKEAVLKAYGYPPSSWVPSPLFSNFWEYRGKSKIWRKRVYFKNNKVSKIEQLEFGRKPPFGPRRKRLTVVQPEGK